MSYEYGEGQHWGDPWSDPAFDAALEAYQDQQERDYDKHLEREYEAWMRGLDYRFLAFSFPCHDHDWSTRWTGGDCIDGPLRLQMGRISMGRVTVTHWRMEPEILHWCEYQGFQRDVQPIYEDQA